jgi:hypothetical protein
MVQSEGANETGFVSEFMEMMKHEDPLTESIRADFKPGTVAGKGIRPADPVALLIRHGAQVIVLAVIEDQLKQKFGKSLLVIMIRDFVSVLDPFQIPIGKSGLFRQAIFFVELCFINTFLIFRLISIVDAVTPGIKGKFEKPLKNFPAVRRIGDSALGAFTINGGDIIRTYGAPVARPVLTVFPSLDAGKQALDPGAVSPDVICLIVFKPCFLFRLPMVPIFLQEGDEVFST